jgi:hypothetical protein
MDIQTESFNSPLPFHPSSDVKPEISDAYEQINAQDLRLGDHLVTIAPTGGSTGSTRNSDLLLVSSPSRHTVDACKCILTYSLNVDQFPIVS